MNRKQYIEEAINSGNNVDGNSFFVRANFNLPYEGMNGFGSHEDLVSISIYEPFSNENVNCTTFNEPLLKSLLAPQVSANVLPSRMTDPDYYRDLYEFGVRDITHSLYIWDKKISLLDIKLEPVYFVQKVIFVLARMDEIINLHELHVFVSPIPL